ncbi:DUF5776 domain-containing protein [Apilactobacillus micheneri]|uniref:DUF5776 domain-containing protein n=1 Tax=Apilactobacillus micheneri TaxID=1899430 RepID=UPI0011268604|nr:DUF5776 domain-containing protein [Apilactobacillus micheneri]TPR43340.1 hypothetical protein DY128_07375 [Apilactobacillus micheneri]
MKKFQKIVITAGIALGTFTLISNSANAESITYDKKPETAEQVAKENGETVAELNQSWKADQWIQKHSNNKPNTKNKQLSKKATYYKQKDLKKHKKHTVKIKKTMYMHSSKNFAKKGHSIKLSSGKTLKVKKIINGKKYSRIQLTNNKFITGNKAFVTLKNN